MRVATRPWWGGRRARCNGPVRVRPPRSRPWSCRFQAPPRRPAPPPRRRAGSEALLRPRAPGPAPRPCRAWWRLSHEGCREVKAQSSRRAGAKTGRPFITPGTRRSRASVLLGAQLHLTEARRAAGEEDRRSGGQGYRLGLGVGDHRLGDRDRAAGVDYVGARGQVAAARRNRTQEVDLQVEPRKGKAGGGRGLDRDQHREVGEHRDYASLEAPARAREPFTGRDRHRRPAVAMVGWAHPGEVMDGRRRELAGELAAHDLGSRELAPYVLRDDTVRRGAEMWVGGLAG